MKLILAIVQAGSAGELLNKLAGQGFGATKVASSSGFLKQHSATLFIGAEDAEVDHVIQTITNCCARREADDRPLPGAADASVPGPMPADLVTTGGATIFVLHMVQYEKF